MTITNPLELVREDARREFRDRFRNEVYRKGLRQSDLARLTGLNGSTISNYWQRGHIPQPDHAAKLAAVLGVEAPWLVYGDRADRPPLEQRPPVSYVLTQGAEGLELVIKGLGPRLAQQIIAMCAPGVTS